MLLDEVADLSREDLVGINLGLGHGNYISIDVPVLLVHDILLEGCPTNALPPLTFLVRNFTQSPWAWRDADDDGERNATANPTPTTQRPPTIAAGQTASRSSTIRRVCRALRPRRQT